MERKKFDISTLVEGHSQGWRHSISTSV